MSWICKTGSHFRGKEYISLLIYDETSELWESSVPWKDHNHLSEAQNIWFQLFTGSDQASIYHHAVWHSLQDKSFWNVFLREGKAYLYRDVPKESRSRCRLEVSTVPEDVPAVQLGELHFQSTRPPYTTAPATQRLLILSILRIRRRLGVGKATSSQLHWIRWRHFLACWRNRSWTTGTSHGSRSGAVVRVKCHLLDCWLSSVVP